MENMTAAQITAVATMKAMLLATTVAVASSLSEGQLERRRDMLNGHRRRP
jgi:hypothetical protein